MRSLLLVVLLTLPWPALASQRGNERRAAGGRYELRIEKQGWNGAEQADLRAVYASACSEIAVHFSGGQKFDLPPIRIRHDRSGPIVLFQRSLRGEIIVQLSASGTYWSQHAYQVAHEFCHILCRFKEADRSNLWFEESLCEMASIYALRQMSITWANDAPYRNWKNYSRALKDYADNVAAKYPVPAGRGFAAWFKESRAQLGKKPTQRHLNGIVAMRLLPIFERDPRAWQTLPYLNSGRTQEKQSFKDYLHAWEQSTPPALRQHVTKIMREFGLD